MNKKNLLMSLIIFQGALIVIGIIVIIYTIFIKIQINDNKDYILSNNLDNNAQLSLLNENQYQVKRIEGNRIVFDIYDLENSQKVQTITINEN
ncbi:MAG: hypothetical protein ACKVGX_04470 [Alphaproteobacteria bacterium]|jgi:hypothetical protein|tara:strand:+ start:10675 stop:10953 length:279 start_codon:yes stop_codon:yes gene_type:complete